MKKILYATQSIDSADLKAVKLALRSACLTQGPIVDEFEETVARFCGAGYAVAVNSGTSALHIACMAAGIGGGDEVITSPNTFVASSNSILYCGGKPVFADIMEDNAVIDPSDIERKITKRTRAVIPVDFAGHPADMKEIKELADKHGLIIIEDAAHALGAKYRGSRVGSGKYADMTILSFHAVKHITTGEGGMVLTNDKKLYQLLRKLRTHGITRDPKMLNRERGDWYYEMSALGYNYRLTDIQCALGISQLKKLPAFLKKRREIVRRYDEFFAKTGYAAPLAAREYVDHAYHLYVIRLKLEDLRVSRRVVFDEYRKAGIMVNVHYIPVYSQPYYRNLGFRKGICPGAEKYYDEALTLPLHPGLSKTDIDRVISVTGKIFDKYGK